MAEYDLVVRNGTLATASDVARADIGIIDGRIATIGAKLGAGRREVSIAIAISSSAPPWAS